MVGLISALDGEPDVADNLLSSGGVAVGSYVTNLTRQLRQFAWAFRPLRTLATKQLTFGQDSLL